MYSADDILPAVRSNAERQTDHALFRAYQDSRICQTLARDDVRRTVIPVYMGLVRQLDDELGRLFAWMEEKGLMDNTMIVFCSDHGDYLGDHWMGEKDLFHEPSIRTPLIVYDPRPEADATRGSASDALVEAIDLAPTFQEYFSGPEKPHIFEGRALGPLLRGDAAGWRRYAFAEYDYATRPARLALGEHPDDSRLVMVCDERWKFVWCKEHRPILFDLHNDPKELVDLGGDPDCADIRARMTEAILEWATRFHTRTTKTRAEINRMAGREPRNILIGIWDEDDYEAAFGHPFDERPGYRKATADGPVTTSLSKARGAPKTVLDSADGLGFIARAAPAGPITLRQPSQEARVGTDPGAGRRSRAGLRLRPDRARFRADLQGDRAGQFSPRATS